jgi:hypothetical protein
MVIAMAPRFPREVAYRLQELAREGQLLLTVDPDELEGTWEDLFLTTPRQDEVTRLRTQVLQAQQPWRVTRPLARAADTEERAQRPERGLVVSRRAGTLDECASAVAAAVGSGRIGELVSVTAPMAEDVQLLARALADRGWATVTRDECEAWLLPGVMELAAALADAHRRRHGGWPGLGAADADRNAPTLLGALSTDGDEDWSAWLRSLPEAVLDDGPGFVRRLRRSPWGRICSLRSVARERAGALASAPPGTRPGELISDHLWTAWRRRLAALLDRPDLATGAPAAVLATAGEAAAVPAESAVYVCFGPEPAAVHHRALSRATDRLLVLYQEHSPLPGEADAEGRA